MIVGNCAPSRDALVVREPIADRVQACADRVQRAVGIVGRELEILEQLFHPPVCSLEMQIEDV
jgi:hypothetical protein